MQTMMATLPAEAPRARVLLVESAVSALAALLAVTLHLRLWRARWNEPFALGGDASFYLMEVRSLGRFGTYLSSPSLGWPFGQSVHDLPQGVDNFHWLILKVLYVVSGTTGGAVNLFYVLSSCAVAAMTMILAGLLAYPSLSQAQEQGTEPGQEAEPAAPTAPSGSGLPVPRFVSLKSDRVNLRNGPSRVRRARNAMSRR